MSNQPQFSIFSRRLRRAVVIATVACIATMLTLPVLSGAVTLDLSFVRRLSFLQGLLARNAPQSRPAARGGRAANPVLGCMNGPAEECLLRIPVDDRRQGDFRLPAALVEGAQTLTAGQPAIEEVISEAIKSERISQREPKELARSFVQRARRTGVNPLLLASMAVAGTKLAPHSRGRAGLLQIPKEAAAAMAAEVGMAWEGPGQLLKPEQSLRLGALYLKLMETKFAGDYQLALTAFRQGESAAWQAKHGGRSSETTSYLAVVNEVYGALISAVQNRTTPRAPASKEAK